MAKMEKKFKNLPLRNGVGIVVLNNKNKVFVARRIDNPKNFWQMPQGGVDKGEDFLKAAYRELEEETSIKNVELIKEIEAYGKVVLPSNDRVLGGGRTHLAFVANKKGTEPLPDHITRMPIVVTPKDSRPADEIYVNIKKNKKLIKDFNWLKHGRIHNQTALIVSGGSSTDFTLLKQ